jgi:hypothetical protein
MTGKPPSKPPATDTPATEPGRLGLDDRGNVTWEWADDEELQADDYIGETARLRALTDPSLQLSDDDAGPTSPSLPNPKRLKTGYDPYDSGALGKDGRRGPKNLRELSKWIELRRKMAAKDGNDP